MTQPPTVTMVQGNMNPWMTPPVMIIGTPAYQPPTVHQSDLPVKRRSSGMVLLGFLLIICSISSIGMSTYIITEIGTVDITLASLFSGAVFFVTGGLSIYVGRNVLEKKRTITMTSVLGIIGLIAVLVATGFAVTALKEEKNKRMSCLLCYAIKKNIDFSVVNSRIILSDNVGGACDFMCSPYPYIILGVLAILKGIFALALSFAACKSSCSKSGPSANVTPPSFPNFPIISNMAFSRPSGDYAYNRL